MSDKQSSKERFLVDKEYSFLLNKYKGRDFSERKPKIAVALRYKTRMRACCNCFRTGTLAEKLFPG